MQNKCMLCPRTCDVDRSVSRGICQVGSQMTIAKTMLHMWEEPCISGENGSGAVFFSGCPLHCVFCQNEAVSHGKVGREYSTEELAKVFLDFQKQGANNINLVTGSQFIDLIADTLKLAKVQGLTIPIVFNTSGYETVESLQLLEGLVDVYLPDFKYYDSELAKKYSRATDYPLVARKAISEMVRQRPHPVFNQDGFITSGVIVRQLLLPGHVNDAKSIISYLYNTYGDDIYISMMSQYTPMEHIAESFPELNRRVTKREYESLIDYAISIGVENAFIQDRKVAKESFIPDFIE